MSCQKVDHRSSRSRALSTRIVFTAKVKTRINETTG